ncbi:MAG: HAD hydrolase family protein [Actinobacteria bacterium]|nr:HAD hydrolase family protein [Actinomycetota bacterium]
MSKLKGLELCTLKESKSIELVTIDLDGTLLDAKSQISDANRHAISKWFPTAQQS